MVDIVRGLPNELNDTYASYMGGKKIEPKRMP